MSTLTVTPIQEQLARDFVAKTPDPRFTAASRETKAKAREVPAELTALLRSVLEAVARGDGVTLQTLPSELSTTAAAELLGVSRPTLMRMIRGGEIAAHKVGSHHRLNLVDVQDFRRAQLARRRAAFEELRQLDDELGLE
ncbi:helix-turn-helix domain-containing protein [Jiangella sp. DSM 45060]|uniref:helix-turn-helix domain-containing protein n=1 Tax=Jiangella sp. DSM 45060 TaxID=1798224 RepID=UPI00087B8DCE|nr:helix-turn-helix domain-containing protein [Jiangella sp. DSM 45060]SDT37056.1 DNA binding domain-containing protein, excisionase family [Jiangella sp. DSM 45060]